MSTASKIPDLMSRQFDLFSGVPTEEPMTELKTALQSGRRFVMGDPSKIFVGTVPLEDYLRSSGERAAFTVARLLDEQDWQGFEQRYAATGRAPYAPRGMMGLILYGLMQGVHSLRALERLARLDLGCMWVCGGITPDHANIGRFILLHETSLTSDFFESLTRSVLRASGSKGRRLAGDGTVIEAACSHYKLLKEDALKAHVDAARDVLARTPDDAQAQQTHQQAQRCQEIFETRQANRRRVGKSTESIRISAIEPQAMVQRLKRGRGFAASYKPSVLVNDDRIIVAVAIDPSSETAVMESMLDQSARVLGEHAQEVLLDAGYFDDKVITATLDRTISLLCPSGQWPAKDKGTGLFHKSRFQYDQHTDTYRCPADQILRCQTKVAPSVRTREHRVYGTSSCAGCQLRVRCTQAVKGRKIKRYPEDEMRDALRQIMEHPKAQRVFRQRKAMVEPVFAHLRCQQKLERFRRRGLAAVRREFALHALAYNLSRAVRRLNALLIVLFNLLGHIYPVQNVLHRVTTCSAWKGRMLGVAF